MEVNEVDLKDRHKYLLPNRVRVSGYGGAERKFISERNFDVDISAFHIIYGRTGSIGRVTQRLNANLIFIRIRLNDGLNIWVYCSEQMLCSIKCYPISIFVSILHLLGL